MQIAYVTGADRGLGLGLVQTLLEQGYKVFAGSYFSSEALPTLSKEKIQPPSNTPDCNDLQSLKQLYNDKLTVLKLDVSCQASVDEAAEFIHKNAAYLNLLINNAGTAVDRSGTILDTFYYDDIQKMMEVNAYGALRVTQSVLDILLKGEPKMLINISSLAGSIGQLTRNNQYGYVMSKAAINGQSKLIHNHFKDQGLKVRVLHPGWMRTHIFGDIELMKEAPFEPIDSARAIVKLIDNESEVGDDIFMDHAGKHMPW